MKYYSIHEFSKLTGRTPQTLRNWDTFGRLYPHHTGANGYRYSEKTEQEELVEDLIQIVTVFSCRLQGKRANKTRKLVDELLEESDVTE